VILAKYGRIEYCAMKIMKKEEIIEKKLLQILKRETQIMESIKGAHPFILNLNGVIQTQVSMKPEL
jgi:hypothetical protein